MLLFKSRGSGIRATVPSSTTVIVVVAAIVLGSQPASAKWAFTQQPAAERARACQEQVSFCYNACGSVAGTAVNFCNIQTTGWNCECNGGAGERNVHRYEWPMAVSECRASLATCNDSCTRNTSASERGACYTSCTANYQCNTAEAPRSSLHVKGAYDRPRGYIRPVEDKDIDLTIGMKFDDGGSEQGRSKLQSTGDPGALPKRIPRTDDGEGSDDGSPGKDHTGAGSGKGPGSSHGGRRKGGAGQRDGSGAGAVSAAGPTQRPAHLLQALAICIWALVVSG
ncbi:hypothetical protein LPJ72_002189 [Coemansia sp. Benny D160-2]|nr:hypothetical protein LPJ72_002189 [Coemansia sp. Benny D160-2]